MAFSDYVSEEFKLFWPDPVRAHTNVPIDFRFSYYEKDNRVLTWSLSNAPSWMSIDQYGRVTGTPTGAATHSGITVTVVREGGGTINRTFTCTVGTSDFIFVSTSGSDTSGTGSISSPYASINKAMTMLSAGSGKTIYIRSGTYQEFWTNTSPLQGKAFSAASPVDIRAYPGETVIIDCINGGHGPWAWQTSYVAFNKLKVTRANYFEKAGLVISESDNCIIKDCIVYSCQFSYTTNPAGIYLAGRNIVCDRTIAYNNGDPAAPNYNSSNWIVYLEGDTSSDYIWILNCKSWLSKIGYKIKHAGPKHLVCHNVESFDQIGYGGMSNYSSLRYAAFYNTGAKLGVTDPSAYTTGPFLLEHATIVNAGTIGTELTALDVVDSYLQTSPPVLNNNIFFDDRGAAGTGEYDKRLGQFWIYTPTVTTDARAITADFNLYYSSSSSNIVRSGIDSPARDKDYSEIQAMGRDTHSRFGTPSFTNKAGGDLTVAAGTNGDFGAGVFAGAFVPGHTYGVVGQATETLLVWDGTGGGETPSFTETLYLNAKTRFLRRIS